MHAKWDVKAGVEGVTVLASTKSKSQGWAGNAGASAAAAIAPILLGKTAERGSPVGGVDWNRLSALDSLDSLDRRPSSNWA